MPFRPGLLRLLPKLGMTPFTFATLGCRLPLTQRFSSELGSKTGLSFKPIRTSGHCWRLTWLLSLPFLLRRKDNRTNALIRVLIANLPVLLDDLSAGSLIVMDGPSRARASVAHCTPGKQIPIDFLRRAFDASRVKMFPCDLFRLRLMSLQGQIQGQRGSSLLQQDSFQHSLPLMDAL